MFGSYQCESLAPASQTEHDEANKDFSLNFKTVGSYLFAL